jgi:hypothetical protein
MLDAVKFFYSMCSDTMRFYKTVSELSMLSDGDLRSLGMSREDIPQVAMKAIFATEAK